MLEDKIKKLIQQALRSVFSHEPKDINLATPDAQFGDFAFTSHSLAKDLKQSPQEIASKIAGALAGHGNITAQAVAGYVNITVLPALLGKEVLGAVLKEKNNYGHHKKTTDKAVLEYSSPNTNKPLHLGHIRNNVLGMALYNLLSSQGAKVIPVQIINDRGIHIIKSMLAYQKWGQGQTPKFTGAKGDHFVGKFYVLFEKEFEQEWQEYLNNNKVTGDLAKARQEFFGQSRIGQEAQVMLRAWEQGEKSVRALWKKMNQWVYAGFGATYKVLGSEFKKNYFESKTYLLGKAIVAEGLKKGAFYREADGSVWVDLTADGLDKKILQRSDGTSVYITQDLGLAVQRHKEFKFTGLAYVVGHEQEYHFKVLFLILQKLGYAWVKKLRHLSYGLVFLPEGKMKSREGKVVDADDIMAEVVELAREQITKRQTGIKAKERERRAQAIGLGALKFFLLRVTPTQSIHFNPAEAIAFEGATGPYVQYAHARIASILKSAKAGSIGKTDLSKLSTFEEKAVLLKLLAYPKAVSDAAQNYSPNIVCDYLVGLAQAFNTF
ncbi:MAG: arginine--tRNA ligase, partial [Patescibacteria group bacterium]